jgi:Concanavalin A-like lectin/glucanases superfamily
MIGSRKRVQRRRLSELVLLALALATLVSVLVILPSPSASAEPPPKADYRFQGKLGTSVGTAPALQKIGPGTNTFTTATVDDSSRKVLSPPKGNGLKLDTTGLLSSNGIYTIVVLFGLNDVSNFKRIVDFKNGTSDNGLYVQNGRLRFFPGSTSGATPIAANRYVQVVITRDLFGTVRGYVDGSQQFQFEDAASQSAVISGEDALRFFKDNTSGGTTGEDSGGSVARIRLYDVALSADDVGSLDCLEPTVFKVNSNADLADVNLVGTASARRSIRASAR